MVAWKTGWNNAIEGMLNGSPWARGGWWCTVPISHTSACITLTDSVQRDRNSALSSISGSWAHARGNYPLTIPSHRSIRKAWVLSGCSIVARSWPYLWQLETTNHSQIGGSQNWNSTLVRRPHVWALGYGSYSPIVTFLKSCSSRTCISYTTAA